MLRPVLVLLVGCGGSGTTFDVLIDLRTDLVAGVEFSSLEARIEGSSDVLREPVFADQSFIDGQRVGVVRAASGSRVLEVALLDASRAVIARQRVLLNVESDLGVTVTLTRDCVGTSCDDAQGCVGGSCADVECVRQSGGADCPMPECEMNVDCPGASGGCTAPMCVDGVCFEVPTGACGPDEWCNPTAGCRPLSGTSDLDAGPDPAVDAGHDDGSTDAGVDAGSTDAGTDAGAARCETPVAVSVHTRTQVMTTALGHDGSCGGSGAEAVFSFTIDSPQDVFLTTHGNLRDGRIQETSLYLYRDGCEGELVVCNDDADGLGTSVIQRPALAPGTYVVVADSESVEGEPMTLFYSASDPSIAGDRPGRPRAFEGTMQSGNSCGATAEGIPQCAVPTEVSEAPDHIYYVLVTGTAGSMRAVTFSTCDAFTMFDTSLWMASSTDSARTSLIGCADNDVCPGTQDELVQMLAPDLYFLYVYSVGRFNCGSYALRRTEG